MTPQRYRQIGEVYHSALGSERGGAESLVRPDRLGDIFEPFVQIDGDPGTHGVGLGLAISRDLARAMGGDLAASSAVGRGSTFTITLPMV